MITRLQISAVLDEFRIKYVWDAEGCTLINGWALRSGIITGGSGDTWFLWHLPTDNRRTDTATDDRSLREMLSKMTGFLRYHDVPEEAGPPCPFCGDQPDVDCAGCGSSGGEDPDPDDINDPPTSR